MIRLKTKIGGVSLEANFYVPNKFLQIKAFSYR